MRNLLLASMALLGACSTSLPVEHPARSQQPLPDAPAVEEPRPADPPPTEPVSLRPERPGVNGSRVQADAEREFGEIAGDAALAEVRRARRSILLRQPVSLPPMVRQPDGSFRPDRGSTAAVVRTDGGWTRIVPGGRSPLAADAAAELDRLLANDGFWREPAFPAFTCLDGSSQILVVRHDGRVRTSAQNCGSSGITGRIGHIVRTGALPPLPSVRIDRLGGAFVRLYRFSTGIDQPMVQVVRSQAQWESLWARITARGSGTHVAPPFDFSRDMLLAVGMGTRPSSGYEIRIERVTEGEAELVAHVVRISPGPDCGVAAALTQPVDVVAVPASAKAVRWEMRDELRNCP